jgi:hypothetical protein
MIEKHEIQIITEAIGGVIKNYVERATTPLKEQIGLLESAIQSFEKREDQLRLTVDAQASAIEAIRNIHVMPPKDGKDADMDAIHKAITEQIERCVATIPVPKDGKDADSEALLQLVATNQAAVVKLVEDRIAAFPVPKDGKDADPAVIKQMVAEAVAALPAPKDGKDADPVAIGKMIEDAVTCAVAALPKPKDGKDINPADVSAMIKVEVNKAVAALPAPKDGKDADMDLMKEYAATVIAKLVAAIPEPKPGRDGKSVDINELRELTKTLTKAHVEKAVAAIPKPKDGKDADEATVRRLVREAVAAIPKPKDGKDVDQAAVERRIDDAITKAVAALPAPRDGKDVDYVALRGIVLEVVSQTVDAIPAPKDGRDAAELDVLAEIDAKRSYPRGTWARHRGGLWRAVGDTADMRGWECIINGVDAIEIEQKDERRFTVMLSQSDGKQVLREFVVPVVLDRGVWVEGTADYEKGDAVSWGGSIFIAQVDKPTDQPGTSKQWRLSVKRGRDGKDRK